MNGIVNKTNSAVSDAVTFKVLFDETITGYSMNLYSNQTLGINIDPNKYSILVMEFIPTNKIVYELAYRTYSPGGSIEAIINSQNIQHNKYLNFYYSGSISHTSSTASGVFQYATYTYTPDKPKYTYVLQNTEVQEQTYPTPGSFGYSNKTYNVDFSSMALKVLASATTGLERASIIEGFWNIRILGL